MKKSLLSALLVCSLTIAAMPTVAAADSFDQKIQQQDQKINELKGKQADVQTQVSALETEIEAVTVKVNDLEAKQAKINEDTMKLQDKIAKLKVRIAKREEAIQKQARDVQVNGQSSNFIDAVLEADSLTDAVGRVQAMSTIVKANNDLVEQQKQDKQAVEDNVKANEAKVKELAATQKELENQKNSIANKQAELNVLKASLAAEQATAETDKANLQKEKAAAEAEQARILKEQQEAAKARQAEEARQAKIAEEANKAQAAKVAEAPVTANEVAEVKTQEPVKNNNQEVVKEEDPQPVIQEDKGDEGKNGVDHSSSGNMYAVGQCTWYVKQVAPWAGTYWGNGCQWGASAAADGYLVNSTPAAGSIVVFGAGQQIGDWTADGTYGHVGYVESYNAANNTITFSQGGMGFSSPTGPNIQTVSASGYTYIHR